ncbi:NAC domain-containing protein 62-like [Hevea brasiliensis]|uniref:NAC domain-containing protein 62-like n=1 Tax=Hevea brasiliensis TaxID=3981 RepID=UPI0025EB7604|nr:NAC domain-containing protein 62-like [Hevea brasiliensis]
MKYMLLIQVTKMMTSTISPSESAQEVGAGFRPKEKELVNHFLKLKLLGHDHQVRRIPELDVYKREPWDLPQYSVANSSDEEWYFFHHCRSGRPSRTTKVGYWKNTSRKRKIREEQEEIGTKRIYVFHIGRAPRGERTGWIIYEYTAAFNLPNQRAFVLCKLFKKRMPVTGEVELSRKMAACNLENQNSYQKTNNSAFDEGETSQLMTYENQATDFAIQEEVHSQPTPHLGPFYGCNEQNYDLNSALISPMQDFTCDDLCNEQNYNLNSALNSPMQDFTCDDLWDFSVDA